MTSMGISLGAIHTDVLLADGVDGPEPAVHLLAHFIGGHRDVSLTEQVAGGSAVAVYGNKLMGYVIGW